MNFFSTFHFRFIMGVQLLKENFRDREGKKMFLPFWREALPVCRIQIMKAKNYFACLVICVLLDITTFRMVYFFHWGRQEMYVTRREVFTENSSYIQLTWVPFSCIPLFICVLSVQFFILYSLLHLVFKKKKLQLKMHSIFKTFFSSLKVRESKVSLFPPSKVPISSIVEQNST